MLRLFKADDLPGLVKIESAAQLAPWSKDIFERCFEAGSSSWVVELEGQVIGFVVILFQLGEAHILNICIDPLYQNQGWGGKLLIHALAELKQAAAAFVYLEVRRSNNHAITLYKKLGFKQIGERKDYYTLPVPEDALVFALDFMSE